MSQPEVRRGLGQRRQMSCSVHAHVRGGSAGRRLSGLGARMRGAREVVEVGALQGARSATV